MNGRFRKYAMIAGVSIVVVLVAIIIASGVRGVAIVEGRSMEPLFHTGDIVFLRKPNSENIHIGTIIVYKSGNKYIIHRVIKIYKYNNMNCYIVKGDNNPIPDPGLPPCPYISWYRGVPQTSIKGIVATIRGDPLKIPYLGGLTLLVRG